MSDNKYSKEYERLKHRHKNGLPIVVFVAGPLTSGGQVAWRNAAQAMEIGSRLLDAGYYPIVPHTSMLVDMVQPVAAGEAAWLKWCFVMIQQSHAVVNAQPQVALQGNVQREFEYATGRLIPTFVRGLVPFFSFFEE